MNTCTYSLMQCTMTELKFAIAYHFFPHSSWGWAFSGNDYKNDCDIAEMVELMANTSNLNLFKKWMGIGNT